jgi:serine/threonine-protein kinase
MALSVGELVLDRYVIESLIGQGGMGEVYRARHQTLGMPVAIKTITGAASPELTQRFTREAQLLARVRHPNVVSILDVGRTLGGTPCMVMEFLEGEALDSRLERRGASPWREVRAVALAVLKGLTAIHGAGIVHRDLKPANVLITRGNPSVVKIVDFGIAQPTAQGARKITQQGAVIGTPAYMSPEQLVGGDIDARSDLYALGLMLYELSTGKLPFGDTPDAALQRLSNRVPRPSAPRPLPALPEDGVQVILSALSIDKKDRPQSARAFIALLRGQSRDTFEAAQGSGAVDPTVSPTQHMQPAQAPQRTGYAAPQAPPPRAGTQLGAMPAAPPPSPHAAHTPHGTRLGQAPPQPPSNEQSYAMYEQQPAPTAYMPVHAAPPSRALVAARVPVSRLAQREEQRQLAQLAQPGRAYHLGGGMWFCIVPAGSDAEAAEHAQRVCAGLQTRYGDTCRVIWAPASPAFALTPASLSGAAPLPPEIAALLDRLL